MMPKTLFILILKNNLSGLLETILLIVLHDGATVVDTYMNLAPIEFNNDMMIINSDE